MVPCFPLGGRLHAGSLHQRIRQRGHHLDRAKVRAPVHPVGDDSLLIRHRVPVDHDPCLLPRGPCRGEQTKVLVLS